MYTAKKYLEKYAQAFSTIDKNKLKLALNDLYLEFSEETHMIAQIRGLTTHLQIVRVVKDQNRKWNHLRKLFIKELGFTIMPKNFFKDNF